MAPDKHYAIECTLATLEMEFSLVSQWDVDLVKAD